MVTKSKRKKRRVREYRYEPMIQGAISKEEHIAAELMGDVGTLNIRLSVLQNSALTLRSLPWITLWDDDDLGYVIQAIGGTLAIVRCVGQRWAVDVPPAKGTYLYRFSHDNKTVIVRVTVIG